MKTFRGHAAISLAALVILSGCELRRSELRILVNSKVQQAVLVESMSGREASSSLASPYQELLKTLVPYEKVGSGEIENPDYVVRLFVAGNWAEVRVAVSEDAAKFSFDNQVCRSGKSDRFQQAASDLLKKSNGQVPQLTTPPDALE